jgi:hypothetical protein
MGRDACPFAECCRAISAEAASGAIFVNVPAKEGTKQRRIADRPGFRLCSPQHVVPTGRPGNQQTLAGEWASSF